MIRKAILLDIDVLLNITKECALQMINKGIYQWNDQYPSKKAFKNDLGRNELYVLEDDKKVIGCIVISTLMDAEYENIDWFTESRKNIYIHRLAIHPNNQGKGFAQKLMTFAENYAKENKFQSVRLDTFSLNKRNQKFYIQRGYKQLGNIYFPKQSTFPFYCFELIF